VSSLRERYKVCWSADMSVRLDCYDDFLTNGFETTARSVNASLHTRCEAQATQSARRRLTISASQPPLITLLSVGPRPLSSPYALPIFEYLMSQPDHEAFNMAEMPGVETGAGGNLALRYHAGPIASLIRDTMSRSPTSVRTTTPTARTISICR